MAHGNAMFSKLLINAMDGRMGEEARIAPYFPSSHHVVEHMLDLAKVTDSDVVYDIGSGDGRIVEAACRRGVGRAVGIELDSHLAAHSRKRLAEYVDAGKAEILAEDCTRVDLTPASVVVIYMGGVGAERLQGQMEELGEEVRIVVHDYPFDASWPPREHVTGVNVVPVAEGGVEQEEEAQHRLSYDLFLYSTADVSRD